MRCFFAVILTLLCFNSFCQTADFIVLKKKGKTIKSYYAGTQIEFVTQRGGYKNALINKISNDTLYVQEFIIQNMVTQFGFYVLDTLGSYRYSYHYKEILSIGKPQKGFNLRGSGSALLGGGILLTLASGVVYLADRDKFSPELMGAAAGLGVVGYFLSKSGSKGMVIGKKNYRIEYINLSKP